MPDYRAYIDESGDHAYRNVDSLDKRYLALTAILVRQDRYDSEVRAPLEQLKKKHFTYDPDFPPVLVRSQIIKREGPFWPLRAPGRRDAWGEEIIAFMKSLPIQIYTVVIDKQAQFDTYGAAARNPYAYCLRVLLNRIRGYLFLRNATADVVAESRGHREDKQLQREYEEFQLVGDQYRVAGEVQTTYPGYIQFRRKDHNVAGLQIADLLAYPQKMEIVEGAGLPQHASLSVFSRRLNVAVQTKINRYGQYLLQ